MLIYNTQTRRKEEFVPIEEGKVRIYACGPTAMLWGSLATFLGMWLYGYAGRDLERRAAAGRPFADMNNERSA